MNRLIICLVVTLFAATANATQIHTLRMDLPKPGQSVNKTITLNKDLYGVICGPESFFIDQGNVVVRVQNQHKEFNSHNRGDVLRETLDVTSPSELIYFSVYTSIDAKISGDSTANAKITCNYASLTNPRANTNRIIS